MGMGDEGGTREGGKNEVYEGIEEVHEEIKKVQGLEWKGGTARTDDACDP